MSATLAPLGKINYSHMTYDI